MISRNEKHSKKRLILLNLDSNWWIFKIWHCNTKLNILSYLLYHASDVHLFSSKRKKKYIYIYIYIWSAKYRKSIECSHKSLASHTSANNSSPANRPIVSYPDISSVLRGNIFVGHQSRRLLYNRDCDMKLWACTATAAKLIVP